MSQLLKASFSNLPGMLPLHLTTHGSDPCLGLIRHGLKHKYLWLSQLTAKLGGRGMLSLNFSASPMLPKMALCQVSIQLSIYTGITQVSLMTFSNIVISTSVKIWSISGISRAPLEARRETISSGGSGVWGVGMGNGKLMGMSAGGLGKTE